MTTKDWIILLIPLAINGIVFYFFQLFVGRKLKKSEDIKELKKNIYNDYFVLVNKTLESFRDATIILVNSADKEQEVIDEFNGKASDLRDDVRKLCFYYEDYKLILGNDKELEHKYNELYQKFMQFNSGETNDAITFFTHGEKLLQSILNITLNGMLKL